MPDLDMALVAVGCAISLAIITETLSWFLFYRHEEFKRAVEEVVDLQTKLENMKEKMQYSLGTQSLNQQKAQ